MIFNISEPLKEKRRRWLLMSPIKPSFILPFVLIPGQILLSNTCLLKRCIPRRDALALNVREQKKKENHNVDSQASLLPAQRCDVQVKEVIEKILRVYCPDIDCRMRSHLFLKVLHTRVMILCFLALESWRSHSLPCWRSCIFLFFFFILFFHQLRVYDHRAY